MSSITREATVCLSKSRIWRLSVVLFSLDMLQDTLRAPASPPSLHQGLFLFFPTLKKNYRCCHPLTCTTACSHGKCKRGPAFEVRLSLPVRGGQVTKQMFTVFLEMICSLLSVDSGPAITSVTLIECWVRVGRRGHNGWTRWWCYTVNVGLYAHKFHGNFMKVMILTGERICP